MKLQRDPHPKRSHRVHCQGGTAYFDKQGLADVDQEVGQFLLQYPTFFAVEPTTEEANTEEANTEEVALLTTFAELHWRQQVSMLDKETERFALSDLEAILDGAFSQSVKQKATEILEAGEDDGTK